MKWKALLTTILHVAVQGAIVGGAGAAAGGSFKAIGLAALAGAVTAIWHLWSPSPGN